MGIYLPINCRMRRKAGELIPIEVSILEAGVNLRSAGVAEFHGFQIAGHIRKWEEARLLTAYGTLYKALKRMQRAGLLVTRWEDPAIAAADSRPRRRLYEITPAGEVAVSRAHRLRADPGLRKSPGPAAA